MKQHTLSLLPQLNYLVEMLRSLFWRCSVHPGHSIGGYWNSTLHKICAVCFNSACCSFCLPCWALTLFQAFNVHVPIEPASLSMSLLTVKCFRDSVIDRWVSTAERHFQPGPVSLLFYAVFPYSHACFAGKSIIATNRAAQAEKRNCLLLPRCLLRS